MKKIVTSIIILLMAVCIFQASYATEGDGVNANIPLSFAGDTKISQDTQKITYTISLGDFTGIPQNPIMGYEAVLEYDKNIFESVTVEGLNNWTSQYDESTGRLIGETKETAQPNKGIAKITLTLNQNVNPGNTTIKLKNVLLTVNDDIDFEYEKEATLTIEEKSEDKDKEETNGKNEEEAGEDKKEEKPDTTTSNNNSTGTSINKANTDKTTTSAKLPKTGTYTIALIVLVIGAVGIVCLIRYKSIETK